MKVGQHADLQMEIWAEPAEGATLEELIADLTAKGQTILGVKDGKVLLVLTKERIF